MKLIIGLNNDYSNSLYEQIISVTNHHGIKVENNIDHYNVFLTTPQSDAMKTKEALIKGAAVFSYTQELSDLAIDDLISGFLRNDGNKDGWYAKLFENPIIVATPGNLELRLGATINPRAIILNSGFDGKGGNVLIDRGTHIGADCLLNLGPTNFVTGKFSLISANFSAHATRHTTEHISNYAVKKGPFGFFGEIYEDAQEIKIGHDVWIGEGVTCLPGVEVATGSVVGAGSVLTKSTQPYGIYAGNPAKFIRPRFNETVIEILFKSQWWDFEFKRLENIQSVFKKKLKNFTQNEIEDLLQC